MSNNATQKPVAAITNAKRLDAEEKAIDWDHVDAIVQAELAAIDRAIDPSLESIRVRGSSTHGQSWRLFSYRAFESQPSTGIDPVVVGLTFTTIQEINAYSISGDICGELLGDLLFEVPQQEVFGSTAVVVAAARGICSRLVAESGKILAALGDSSRKQ